MVGRSYAPVRRIFRTSSGSFLMYLPMKWVKAQGLDKLKKARVIVEFDDEKIVIRKRKEE